MSDVVAELRALLAEATDRPWKITVPGYPVARTEGRGVSGLLGIDVDGDAIFVREEDATMVVAAVNHLGALLDVAEAARELHEGGDRPDGSWGRLGRALERLDGDADA